MSDRDKLKVLALVVVVVALTVLLVALIPVDDPKSVGGIVGK